MCSTPRRPNGSKALLEALGDCVRDPVEWAKAAVGKFGADLVCLKLDGCHPDKGNRPVEHAVNVVQRVRDAVGCPLIIWGCDDEAKDNELMPKVSQAVKGERCLLGCAKQDNYKTITAVCHADGHNLIALAPLDINIQKQVHILISDMEFPADRIVMFPTTGALGYGLEYAYSIQERSRLAALGGDKMMRMPVLVDAGNEAWRAKEAKAEDADAPRGARRRSADPPGKCSPPSRCSKPGRTSSACATRKPSPRRGALLTTSRLEFLFNTEDTENERSTRRTNSGLIEADLTEKIIGAAITVHKALGPGLLESVFEQCFCHELRLLGLRIERQIDIPAEYKGVKLDCGYRLDILVEGRVIVEVKAVEALLPIHEAQLLTYLRLAGKRVGLLINFNTPVLKKGIIRRVL